MDMLKKVWGWFGKKLIVTLVGLVLVSLKAQHPDWVLPSEEMTKELVIAFLSCHTLTDIVATIKTAVPVVVQDVATKLIDKETAAK